MCVCVFSPEENKLRSGVKWEPDGTDDWFADWRRAVQNIILQACKHQTLTSYWAWLSKCCISLSLTCCCCRSFDSSCSPTNRSGAEPCTFPLPATTKAIFHFSLLKHYTYTWLCYQSHNAMLWKKLCRGDDGALV